MRIGGRLVVGATDERVSDGRVAAILVGRSGPSVATLSATDGSFLLELPVGAGDTIEIRVAESSRYRAARYPFRVSAGSADRLLAVGRISVSSWELDAEGQPVPLPRIVTFLRAIIRDDRDTFGAGEYYFYFDVRDPDRRGSDGLPIGDFRISGLYRVSSGSTVTFSPRVEVKVPYEAARFEVNVQAKEDDTPGRDVNPFLDRSGRAEILTAVGAAWTARDHYGKGREHRLTTSDYAIDYRID